MKTLSSILFCFCFIASAYTVSAQGTGSATSEPPAGSTLTLQQCIDMALERNLTIKTNENNLELAKLDFRQSQYSYAPTLNGNVGLTRTYGATFDPITFARIQGATWTSQPSLTAQLPLLAGLSRYYVLQQNKNALAASREALANQKNVIMVSVIRSYLQLIFDRTQVDIVNYRIKTLQAQEDRTRRLYESGAGVLFDVLNVQSQLAVEQNNLITAENTLQTDRITLLQLLQLNPKGKTEEGYQFAAFDTTGLVTRISNEIIPSVVEVENTALQSWPSIKQQQANLLALRYTRRAAWSRCTPTLNLSGFLQSSYSTNSSSSRSERIQGALVPLTFLDVNGNLVSRPDIGYTTATQSVGVRTDYFGQLSDNFSYGFAFTLNVPLFNGWTVSRQARGAWINLKNAEVQYETSKNQIISDVRRSHIDLTASKARIQNLTRQQTAQDEAFANAEARFNAGLINFQQYVEILNNRTSLLQQKVQAIYEYVLRRKILDFYNAKPITFNEK